MKLDDIAEICGVSSSTVSRALNNDSRISRETIQKVHEIAAKHKFVPTKRKRQASRSIINLLLVVPDAGKTIDNPFYEMGDLINAINSAFGNKKACIETITASQSQEIYEGNGFSAHGVLFAFGKADSEFKLFLDKRNIPYIFLNRTLQDENYVSCNNFKGIIRLVEHLKQRGYKRVGYLSCPSIAVNSDRLRGYQIGSIENYGGFEPDLVMEVDSISEIEKTVASYFVEQNCDAIIGFNDNFAIRLISELQGIGVKVPDDIAVTGFDSSPLRKVFKPLLTTICLSTFEMEFFAARWLGDNIIHKESRELQLEVNGQLLIGQSVK